ncbi:hypothetical protein LUZ63_002001 [Rhynchospora breviuscula]|uniref:Protein unc-13 homolog n=1 Tax=Rhynchospora breviuscula TaxID=2022672 RepID=A0A9Q0HXL8_9POAL|nr:hypothetical protein LUZ63_002001 [Rhynchospora breviuscula]
MDACYMLNRFHHDRHNLLEYLLSSGLIRSRSAASIDLAGVDLDSISPDYVIECILSGSDFDPSEATRRYFESLRYPITAISSQGKPLFFLSSPDPAGSPPHRAAPSVSTTEIAGKSTVHLQIIPDVSSEINVLSTSENGIDNIASEINEVNEVSRSEKGIRNVPNKFNGVSMSENGTDSIEVSMEGHKPANIVDTTSLNLPELTTGLRDVDMQETAYEVLLACILPTLPQSFSAQPPIPEEKKKDKKSLLLKRLRSKKEGKKEGPGPPSEPEICYPDILNLIRAQMEISEAMDELMKQGLRSFSQRKGDEQISIPFISLELLHSISKLDFQTERSRTHFIKRQANILEELLLCSANTDSNMRTSLGILLTKIRSSEEWVVNSGDSQVEVLTVIQRYASMLADSAPKFNLHGESCCWTSSYYFNMRLYEKLLCTIFDVLEEGQIVEEAEDILELMKLTWATLGVTQELHDALIVWVLFEKFNETGQVLLLKYALREIENVISKSSYESNEEAYVNSILCSIEEDGHKRNLNLVDTVVFKISAWCRFQLEDYHLHFSQDNYPVFGDVVKLMVMLGTQYHDKFEVMRVLAPGTNLEMKMLHFFVEKSIQAACNHVTKMSDNIASSGSHPLAVIANELDLIAEKEFTKFSTILCSYYSEAGRVAFILLHLFYGERLKPFLEEITHLSEPLNAVLSAANNLELSLARKLYSLYGESVESPMNQYVDPYQIPNFSSPLILQWIQAQHEKILEWTNRAVELEDWEPLSSNKKQANSAVEVFRIMEETIEQFFSSNLPMDTIHLRFLLIGISRSLEAYVLHIVDQQVDKTILYPSKPILTRHSESTNHFIKRKHIEQRELEEKVTVKLKSLTVLKLCVKLNTLRYIRNQLDSMEDSITESWRHLQLGLSFSDYFPCIFKGHKFTSSTKNFLATDQSVDELFTVFDDVRKSSIEASEKILDFIGARAIFLDLRQSFLFSLYRGSVDQARSEIFIPQLDQVLDRICDLIIDELRDQVVLSICRASMEGFIWILLDGGPSRAFSESNVEHMQEDLTILKDLFIANGHGLPPDEVEMESKLVHGILDLYALKTEMIIEMLMHASEQANGNSKPAVGTRTGKDAQTLLRVLCHKKERGASKFLKLHYQFPRSSEYDDLPESNQTPKLPSLSGIFKRSQSIDWSSTLTRQGSLKSFKKKFQEAASEIRKKPW